MVLLKKGMLNLLFDGISFAGSFMKSLIRRQILSLRGFDISQKVNISDNVIFFQSTTHAVSVGLGSEIGSGVRIKAGFDGKITVGKHVLIDDYSYISAHKSITIGDNTMISAVCYIVDFNHIAPLSSYNLRLKENSYTSKEIVIGKNVWIGTHSVILPGVTIGDYAVVGAGSVVTKSVPPYTVVVGNPAGVIKKIKV